MGTSKFFPCFQTKKMSFVKFLFLSFKIKDPVSYELVVPCSKGQWEKGLKDPLSYEEVDMQILKHKSFLLVLGNVLWYPK